MPEVIITLTDTPEGLVATHSNFTPAVGKALSPAQAAGLDIVNRTNRLWGVAGAVVKPAPVLHEVNIDAVHRTRDRVVGTA